MNWGATKSHNIWKQRVWSIQSLATPNDAHMTPYASNDADSSVTTAIAVSENAKILLPGLVAYRLLFQPLPREKTILGTSSNTAHPTVGKLESGVEVWYQAYRGEVADLKS